MNLTYKYDLILQIQEPTEWLEKKADEICVYSKELPIKTIRLKFNTFCLNSAAFQEVLQKIDEVFTVYTLVVVGEHMGHIEVYKKGMPAEVKGTLTINGQEYKDLWNEIFDD